jgi:membrane protease YdiL (CAAX protease family)
LLGRDTDVFIVLWLFTIVFFMLATFNNFLLFAMTLTFGFMGGASLVVLQRIKSDQPYYNNLNVTSIAYACAAVVVMLVVSLGFTALIGGSLLRISQIPLAVQLPPILVTVGSQSLLFALLSEILYTFAVVAAAEELLKLAGYAEIKKRWSMTAAILVAVGLWAAFHAIQSYSNWLYIIPAFLNGLVMIGVLEYTKSFLTTVIAHGGYNSVTVIMQYASGTNSLPLLPAQLTPVDFLVVILIIIWAAFLILPIVRRKQI